MQRRIPLSVEAVFSSTGMITPRQVMFRGVVYAIDRVLSVRPFCPPDIAAIAPLRYIVLIGGTRKEIYYEPSTRTWFSVRSDGLL